MKTILVLLLLIGPIRIKALQQIIEQIHNTFSSVIGDSYIFSTSPSQREAVATKVAADIEWLGERCEKIVVVAHSQGAAVAYMTLKKMAFQKVKLLVTVGSGLVKLFHLDETRELRAWVLNVFALGAICFSAAMTLEMANILGFIHSAGLSGIRLIGGGVGLLIYGFILSGFLIWYLRTFGKIGAIHDWAKYFHQGGERVWADIYASLDPVPNGPMPIEPSLVESIELRNANSLLLDHNTYHRNIEEFYPELLKLIDSAGVSCLPMVKLSESERLIQQRTKHLRWIRLRFHGIDKMLLLIAALLVCLNPDTLAEIGGKLNSIILGLCKKWDQLSFAEVASEEPCWAMPAVRSGLLVVITGWVLSNYLFRMIGWVKESIALVFLFSRIKTIGNSSSVIIYYSFLHFVWCLILATILQITFVEVRDSVGFILSSFHQSQNLFIQSVILALLPALLLGTSEYLGITKYLKRNVIE